MRTTAVNSALDAPYTLAREQLKFYDESGYDSGWTFHRAGPNNTNRMREVFTIIYMGANMRLAAPQNKNQMADWQGWCPQVKVGEAMDAPLTPVLYESQ